MCFLHDGILAVIIGKSVIIKVSVLKPLCLPAFDTLHAFPLFLHGFPFLLCLLLAGTEAAEHEIAGASEPGHDSLAAATAFLTVNKPVSLFYVFVPGKLYISGGSVNGRPDFCGNLNHMLATKVLPITYNASYILMQFLPDSDYFSSPSTSAISRAVAVTIRIPV